MSLHSIARWLMVSILLALWPLAVIAADPSPALVATFNPSARELPENLVLDSAGNIYINLWPTGEIRELAPDGSQSTFAKLDVGNGNLLGLAVDRQNDVYALLSSHNSPGSDTHGVWRVHPDGTKELFAALDPTANPNQPVFDARGNLLVSDSAAGRIWSVDPAGAVSLWLSDPLLQPNVQACPAGVPPIGVNGLAFDSHGVLFAANSSKASIVKISLNPDGSAGTPSAFAQSCDQLAGSDGIAFDAEDNLYVAVNTLSMLVRLSPGGSLTPLATAADGLDNPSAVAFGLSRGAPTQIFITNSAIGTVRTGGTPHPSLMQMEAGTAGAPVSPIP